MCPGKYSKRFDFSDNGWCEGDSNCRILKSPNFDLRPKNTTVDLIVLHTEWDEFKSLEFNKIVKKKSFSVFDLRNLYDQKIMKNKKIKYFSVGRPSSI